MNTPKNLLGHNTRRLGKRSESETQESSVLGNPGARIQPLLLKKVSSLLTVVKETAGCFVQLPSNRGRQGSDPHWVALFKESRLAGFDENRRSSMWLGGSTAMGTVYSHIRALCPCSLFYLVGCLSRPIQVLAQSFFYTSISSEPTR